VDVKSNGGMSSGHPCVSCTPLVADCFSGHSSALVSERPSAVGSLVEPHMVDDQDLYLRPSLSFAIFLSGGGAV